MCIGVFTTRTDQDEAKEVGDPVDAHDEEQLDDNHQVFRKRVLLLKRPIELLSSKLLNGANSIKLNCRWCLLPVASDWNSQNPCISLNGKTDQKLSSQRFLLGIVGLLWIM